MKEITKIVIKGASGYCSVNYAFKDKVTLTPDSISYECNPYAEESHIQKRKWSYKTTSPSFQETFKTIADGVNKELEEEIKDLWLDAGSVDLVVTFADKTKRTESYFVSGEYFHDLFMIIKQLVPGIEEIPEVLKTEEDYDEEDYDDGDDKSYTFSR